MNFRWKSKTISSFKLDLAANLAGSAWSTLMQLVCIPLYIRFMGIEAYGLIGFYLILQAILQVLDLGLSPTMNREMARYSVQPEKAAEAHDLVRTLEAGYWLMGFVVAAILLGSSTWIATHWLKANSLAIHDVRQAALLMGVLAFFQWPVSFYQGGLMGLRQQVAFNAVRIGVVTLSTAGAVMILWLVSPSIQTFLCWQVAVSAVQAVALAMLLRKCLPTATRAPRFQVSMVRNLGRFAAGMGGITLIGLVLTQIDKVFVSKLLSLKVFGYYTAAWSLANGLLIISGILFNVIFPRMAAQVAAGNEDGLRQSYHRGSQLMAVLILPLAALLSFFSFDVLRLWTRNTEMASFAAPILSILVIGSALNALLFLPYAVQLAFGWTKLNLIVGLVSIAIVVPAIIPMTKHFGPVGAAAVWAALNVVTMLVVVPIMHRRFLLHEMWGYFGDVGFPLIAVLAVTTLGRLTFPNITSPVATLAATCSVWLCAFVAAVLAAPQIRSLTLAQLITVKPQYVKRFRSAG